MSRFNHERAETFGAYTATALVRDAGKRGRIFVKVSRKELSTALNTSKLHGDHVASVKVAAEKWGVGMADMTSYFLFFDADIEASTETVGAKDLGSITDHFDRLSTEAADEAWDDGSYLPKRAPAGRSKERVAAEAVKEKTRTIRLRG